MYCAVRYWVLDFRENGMNLLISPLLIIGLLASTSPDAGQCVAAEISAATVCETCAVKASIPAASDQLDRQARKHTEFYLTLVRAQQKAGAEPAGARQYSARTDSAALPEFQTPEFQTQ